MQPFQPLTQDQWQKAQDAGFTPDQIIANEKQRKLQSTPQPSLLSKVGGVVKGIGNALSSSEQALGQDVSSAIIGNTQNKNTEQQNKNLSDIDANNIKTIIGLKNKAVANGQDPSHYDTLLKNYQMTNGSSLSEIAPSLNKSNLQVLGDSAGVLLDVLSAGSYGEAAKGAKTGELLAKTEKVAQPIVKQTLGQTLKTIGIKTAERAGIGAGTGYAYDVAGNLQNGKTGVDTLKPGMGTLTGAVVPTIIGGIQAGVAISKDTAPRFINSLIKPKQADFSYGKDPGRTVSEMGITGNNLNDFAHNINTTKNDVGEKLGAIYSAPENAGIRIDANPEITKIDEAIKNAAKGGKENQGIVTALQNTKDAILYEHQVNADGVIEKVGTTPRDLSSLSPKEVFDLKKVVAEQTKFTGKPSDDKTVNSVLKNIYGGLKEKLNTTLGVNNPEIIDLNQKYADLTSAELATRNRDAIIRRSDLVSNPIKIGIATTILSGGMTIPAVLAGAGASMLDKALESTAVKTRIAAWLGSAEPSAITKLIQQNPAIKTTLYRLVPKLGNRLGQ